MAHQARELGLAVGQPLSPEVLQRMWSSPRGREAARRIACRDTGRVEMCRLAGLLSVAEYVRQGCWPGEPTPDEDAVVWQAVQDVLAGYGQGQVTEFQLGPLAAAWKRSAGLWLWKTAEGGVGNAVWRAELAYLLGRRYLHHFGKRDDSAALFADAARLASADSRLKQLARTEADRLKRK
jgi:hypothetical protein